MENFIILSVIWLAIHVSSAWMFCPLVCPGFNVYTFGTSFIYEFIFDRVFVYFIFNIVICVSVDVYQSEIFIFDCSLLICFQNLPDLSN